MEVNEPNFEKIFNLEDRLVRFAGECILFVRKLEKSYEVDITKINSLDHLEVLP